MNLWTVSEQKFWEFMENIFNENFNPYECKTLAASKFSLNVKNLFKKN